MVLHSRFDNILFQLSGPTVACNTKCEEWLLPAYTQLPLRTLHSSATQKHTMARKGCKLLPWTRWMHDILGWAWASAHAECGPVVCTTHQNVTEPLATRYHTNSIAYTGVQHGNCESGLAKAHNKSRKWLIVSGQSKQASKQAPNIHTHECNEVTLVWGSLRLTQIRGSTCVLRLLWGLTRFKYGLFECVFEQQLFSCTTCL